MLALTRSEVQQLVPMPDAIALMKTAFAELSAGRTDSPLRLVVPVPEVHGDALFMPARVPALDALGVKIVNVFQQNRAKDLPVIHALVAIIDPETGQMLAIMDGTYLTALRTGAVSGAATDLLARPESKTLVAIGAGAQGATQIAAVCAVRPIERIVAVDRDEGILERLRANLSKDWPNVVDRLETTTDAAPAVREADIICTATTSKSPVFNDADVKPGTHINAIGAFTPEMQELPVATVARATIILDAVEAALAEAGDFIIPLASGEISRDKFGVELGQIVSGDAPGRRDDQEITLFKSVGNAVQDVAVGRQAVNRARELGVGIEIELGI